MRFMVIRKADNNTEAGMMPTDRLRAEMAKYNEALVKAGVMVDSMGLQASSKGARLQFSNGAPTLTDGPFAEAKELIAGFIMLEVPSQEEAIEWAKRWPAIDGDSNVVLEIRQVFCSGT